MRYLLAGLISLFLANVTAHAEIIGKSVEYTAKGVTLKGYLAYDDSIKTVRPGVLVVHEWWGHNEYARTRANMLAKLGYTALAVDMYGDGKTANHPKEAGKFASEVAGNLDVATDRFMAAMTFLKTQTTVDPSKIAAIGYCFGGGVVLEMARAGIDLKGVASFHGSLATKQPAAVGKIKAKVLVLHGEADALIPLEQVAIFKQEMQNAKADLTFVGYPGVKHGFTNPAANEFATKFDLPLAYDEKADKESWHRLQVFLTQIFK